MQENLMHITIKRKDIGEQIRKEIMTL